jgi:hypothetical protein
MTIIIYFDSFNSNENILLYTPLHIFSNSKWFIWIFFNLISTFSHIMCVVPDNTREEVSNGLSAGWWCWYVTMIMFHVWLMSLVSYIYWCHNGLYYEMTLMVIMIMMTVTLKYLWISIHFHSFSIIILRISLLQC